MKIEIEIDEQTAACVWANHNPCRGRFPETPLAEIVKGMVQEDAAKFAALTAQSAARALADFRNRKP